MSTMKYTNDHEWARIEDDGSAVFGITDHAQQQLGDLVFVELPEVGTEVEQGEESGVLESVKAAGDFKAPISGTVIAVNDALADDPAIANGDPTGEGWFFKVTIANASELDNLMDEEAYAQYIDA